MSDAVESLPAILPLHENERSVFDEAAAIRSARSGSADAAEALVRHFWPDAYRCAYLVIGEASEAEDVTQEAMITALRTLHRFIRGRPSDRGSAQSDAQGSWRCSPGVLGAA